MSSSASNSQAEALRRMSKLVNSLMARSDCGPFREPVDWRGLELYDYPKIIKKMMDLGTVKRKLERGQYRTAHECAEDVRLVWNNCMVYNMEGSDFWLLAKSFSRRFEDRYKKVRAEYDTGESLADGRGSAGGTPEASSSKATKSSIGGGGSSSNKLSPSSAPSLDVKVQFGSNLFLLSGMELAHVMRTIEERCPEALEDIGSEEQTEINVDAIDGRTLTELDRYVREKVGTRHANMPDADHHTSSLQQRSNKKRKR